MLIELVVRDLGVIAQARVSLSEGMTALTGETGAGKTLVIEALRLLTGRKADPGQVRAGSEEAVVEGLFVLDDTEWVLRRVVPSSGRSRCYVNGELVPATRMAELTGGLIEIHGQHGQQALLDPRTQRAALDRFVRLDRTRLDTARRNLAELERELESIGGEESARQRYVGLLEHQVEEIARISPGVDEVKSLVADEDRLANAMAHRESAGRATELLTGDDGALDQLARARAELGEAPAFTDVAIRLTGLQAELSDCSAELRSLGEDIESDEQRLAEVQSRRQALMDLQRKYGDTIDEVLEFAERAREELESLRKLEFRRSELAEDIRVARDELIQASEEVGAIRRSAAPRLARSATALLRDLGLGDAVIDVEVGDQEDAPGAGGAVEIKLTANPGHETASLARIASGGELSRVMLALRLVLSDGPPTMVFDEVDAGVGGAAAIAVGAALAELAERRQVLVVTHLAQVAAAADAQIAVHKRSDARGTSTDVRPVRDEERVIEISRMLSGFPDLPAARRHAEELLAARTARMVL